VFYLLTLPFRLFFGLLCGLIVLPFTILFLPFLLLRLILKAVFAIVMLPFALLLGVVGIAIALIAVSFALFLPLMPFLFVAACVWLLMRSSRAATAIQG
jgi:hypothetical protein